MPGDCLALAIRVGRQVQGSRLAQRSRDRVDVALVLLQDLVLHRVVAIGIDGALLGHQITNVTIGGENFKVLAKVLLDGLRLGGRFHYDQVVCHCLLPKTKNRGRAADLHRRLTARLVLQCGALGCASDTRSSSRWNANSCPGWLDNTIRTTHLSCSVSSSSA